MIDSVGILFHTWSSEAENSIVLSCRLNELNCISKCRSVGKLFHAWASEAGNGIVLTCRLNKLDYISSRSSAGKLFHAWASEAGISCHRNFWVYVVWIVSCHRQRKGWWPQFKISWSIVYVQSNDRHSTKCSAVHCTCNVHLLSLVGETWRKNFKDVDRLVALFESIFTYCFARKLIYKDLRSSWLTKLVQMFHCLPFQLLPGIIVGLELSVPKCNT